MNHTVVSFTKFCEWVQGKTVRAERDVGRCTEITFEDGTEVVFYSNWERRFGEMAIEPPMVTIREKETP